MRTMPQIAQSTLLISILCLGLFAGLLLAPRAATAEEEARVVYHADYADPRRFSAMLTSINNMVTYYQNELIDYETFAANGEGFYHEKVSDVFRLYQQRLVEASAVDFDDILVLTVDIFRAFPEVLAHYQQLFQYLLVDEYQDTNHAQYVLVKLLAAAHRNIFVVGDADHLSGLTIHVEDRAHQLHVRIRCGRVA